MLGVVEAARRIELAGRAYRALYEDDISVLAGLGSALADLRRLQEIDPGIAASSSSQFNRLLAT